MDVFEQYEADRRERRMRLPGAWNQFRVAVSHAVESYNRISEGVACPAKFSEDDKGIMFVQCLRKQEKLLIVIRSHILSGNVVPIAAEVQHWPTEGEPSVPYKAVAKFEFMVEPSPEIRLSLDGQILSPDEAADLVVVRGLLGMTVRDSRIVPL